jgi:hypothetical protein
LLQVAPPLLRSMIITALDTGLRQGRIASATVRRHRLGAAAHRAQGRNDQEPEESLGTARHRARLRAVLDWLQLQADFKRKPDDALVFSDEAGEPIGRFRTAWITAVRKAHGIEPEWRAYGWTALTPACQDEFRRINLHSHGRQVGIGQAVRPDSPRIRDGFSHFLHNRPDQSETRFAGRERRRL